MYCLQTIDEPACVILTLFQFFLSSFQNESAGKGIFLVVRVCANFPSFMHTSNVSQLLQESKPVYFFV